MGTTATTRPHDADLHPDVSSDDEPSGVSVGDSLGRYRLVRAIGQGGMGSVFEAVHDEIGRRVAVKVLQPALATRDHARSRFFREARAAARVQHRAWRRCTTSTSTTAPPRPARVWRVRALVAGGSLLVLGVGALAVTGFVAGAVLAIGGAALLLAAPPSQRRASVACAPDVLSLACAVTF